MKTSKIEKLRKAAVLGILGSLIAIGTMLFLVQIGNPTIETVLSIAFPTSVVLFFASLCALQMIADDSRIR